MDLKEIFLIQTELIGEYLDLQMVKLKPGSV